MLFFMEDLDWLGLWFGWLKLWFEFEVFGCMGGIVFKFKLGSDGVGEVWLYFMLVVLLINGVWDE